MQLYLKLGLYRIVSYIVTVGNYIWKMVVFASIEIVGMVNWQVKWVCLLSDKSNWHGYSPTAVILLVPVPSTLFGLLIIDFLAKDISTETLVIIILKNNRQNNQ